MSLPLADLTPPNHFFKQHLQQVPALNAETWALLLHGLVRQPLTLDYPQINTHAAFTSLPCTIACAGSSARNILVGQAVWSGVPVQAFTQLLDIADHATHVQLYGLDGYSTYLARPDFERALLATHMNGQPLPPEHGFPVRLVVPQLYGYKMPKWVHRATFTDQPMNGYWEDRGWAAEGHVQPYALLLSPVHLQAVPNAQVMLSGIAHAGLAGLARIEISIDDADWASVPFEQANAGAWARWQLQWEAPYAGDHLIQVRAIDYDGLIQGSALRDSRTGFTDTHRIIVRITA